MKNSSEQAFRARCIMVLGTTSGAGKSWLASALCRHYARQGFKVAPFKAQNMSNNARVVAAAAHKDEAQMRQGEIGSAQYFQALAARAVPDVRMNPLLLKPEADTRSQVVLLGQANSELSAMPWHQRSQQVWPLIVAALDELRAQNDVVVIEGAGSPAEINLQESDIVNMRVARHCHAACLLVSDIDRGGAFAHLFGTWALLPPPERSLIRGFVLNKFRGDAGLLEPAPHRLQELTQIPTVAVLPMCRQHGLPEEDGVFDDRGSASGEVRLTVAVLVYPHISNLDEFQPLKNIPGVRLLWVRSPAALATLTPRDWLILPGSKSTSADLDWLRARGLAAGVARHAGQGGAVLGICGGLQMLGEALIDLHGVDGNAAGLGLLPLVTVFEPVKTVRRTQCRFDAALAAPAQEQDSDWVHGEVDVANPWSALAGVAVSGYEIHHGQTTQHGAMARSGDVARAVLPDGLGWQNGQGNVLGIYLHGLFEDPAVLQALFAHDLERPVPTLDSVFDGLADLIETHFEPGVLAALLQPPKAFL